VIVQGDANQQGEYEMLNPTDVNVRSFEHHTRIDRINQHGWLVDSSPRACRANRLPSLFRSVAARLSKPFGLGLRTGRDAACVTT
jgi:hypothetical protein